MSRSARLVARLRLAVVLALEVLSIPLLRGSGEGSPADIDWSHLGRWLAATAPEDAILAAVRLVALAVAAWLFATTLVYLLARAAGAAAVVRRVEWATLPGVRRVVDAAVAASIAASSLVGAHPAGAGEPPAPIVVELTTTTTAAAGHLYVPRPAGDVDTATTSAGEATTTSSTTTTARAQAADAAGGATASVGDAPAQAGPCPHTVVPGDNLWAIAESDLAARRGGDAQGLDETAVRRHWLDVIQANQDRLRSGDPDLIFPGETVILPPAE